MLFYGTRLCTLVVLIFAAATYGQVRPTQTYQPPPAASGNVSSSSNGASGPNERWGELLGNAMYFYDIQRSGTLPDNFRVSWRNNSVPNDGSDVGLNLSGGFFDAGNYIKATFPLCWVVTQLSWGAMMFGSAFDSTSQTAYLDETLRNALDWLMIASSKQDELVVVIGSQDFYWGGDQNIPTNNRPSYTISRKSPGTDVFSSCASALTSASMLYSGNTLPISRTRNGTVPAMQDSGYATTLLQRAESLFNIAQTATPQQVYQKAVKGVSWAYPSTDYADDLVLASTFLALATGNQSYADYAQQTYASSYFPYPSGALNWDQKTSATPVLLTQLAVARPTMNVDFTKYQTDAEVWLDNIVNNKMSKAYTTDGGLWYFKGDSDSSSLNPATNVAWMMMTYRGLASTTAKGDGYRAFAEGQLDYTLGKNPMNTVYAVGLHPNSPVNPQSALASGGTNARLIDTVPAQEAYVLYSGVVGGPNSDDKFYDQRSLWQQTEVAIDCQSPLIVMAAHQIVNNASDPFYVGMTSQRVLLPYTSNTDGSGGRGDGGGLSQGAKIAIAVIVIVVVFGLLGWLAWWQRERLRSCIRRRRIGKY